MVASSVHFKGHRCFGSEWAGFDTIKPINVIIGRNNSGKSRLLDLVETMCRSDFSRVGFNLKCEGILKEGDLLEVFDRHSSGGFLEGNHWEWHGRHFVGAKAVWTYEPDGTVRLIEVIPVDLDQASTTPIYVDVRHQYIKKALERSESSLANRHFRHLASERDIQPEEFSYQDSISPSGNGATALLTRYLTSDNPRFPRDTVRLRLLSALSTIFGPDGDFDEILVRQQDLGNPQNTLPRWEVHLSERQKGIIRLSHAGSGLKTIFLVLINLLLIPEVRGIPPREFVFAFEELENNLHPALQRRLLNYIEAYVAEHNSTVFLTTHSSVALDYFGTSSDAQIIQVSHDRTTATTSGIAEHFDKINLIAELGAKPSDLLQANGILWVEGPSDRVYLNKWIELVSGGKWKEGRHYQCACYGGALLATAQFATPEDEAQELINLLRVNSNVVLVCDSDRTSASGGGSGLKDRVTRVRDEVGKIPRSHLWITEAKEIENYLPEEALEAYFQKPKLPAPKKHEFFFAVKGAKGQSYIETNLDRRSMDKMELAVGTSVHMTKDQLFSRFDLIPQVEAIISRIEDWNM